MSYRKLSNEADRERRVWTLTEANLRRTSPKTLRTVRRGSLGTLGVWCTYERRGSKETHGIHERKNLPSTSCVHGETWYSMNMQAVTGVFINKILLTKTDMFRWNM